MLAILLSKDDWNVPMAASYSVNVSVVFRSAAIRVSIVSGDEFAEGFEGDGEYPHGDYWPELCASVTNSRFDGTPI
jgi:hypothetical protein